MISTVSIMGVDDSVAPEDLADISQKYPFVEWGVNLCSNCVMMPSYPSDEWLEELLSYADRIRLRGVLRGRWERDILAGNLSLKVEKPKLWDALHRIQVDIRRGHKNLIESLQLIPDKEAVLEAAHPQSIIIGAQLNAHLLLPRDKLFMFPGYCGYSLMDGDVELACGRHDLFWINVDGFRSDGITMDLLKVEEVLDLTEDHVTNDSWVKALLQTSAVQKRFSEHP
jgi:hypothetical protein